MSVQPLHPTSPDPVAAVETVTPELAKEWLGRNTRNRALKSRKIDQYARDMKAGRWQLTGEAVKFASDGRLLDGQNRLHAVIRADVAVKMMVVRGVHPAAQDVMDSGIARTVADALQMAGVLNAGRITAAARIALAFEAGVAPGTSRWSNSEVQQWVLDNLDITEAHTILGRDAKLVPLPPAVRLYCAWRLAQIDRDAAVDFFEAFGSGVGLTNGSPILSLRRRLIGQYGAERRITDTERIALVFRVWNAWRKGETLERVLAASRTGVKIPEPV